MFCLTWSIQRFNTSHDLRQLICILRSSIVRPQRRSSLRVVGVLNQEIVKEQDYENREKSKGAD